MWKPALFLLAVVLVTPHGRAVLGQCVHHAFSLFAATSTYGDLAIAAMALVFLGLCLSFVGRRKIPMPRGYCEGFGGKNRPAYRRIAHTEPCSAPGMRGAGYAPPPNGQQVEDTRSTGTK
jgi:hypothetical protein